MAQDTSIVATPMHEITLDDLAVGVEARQRRQLLARFLTRGPWMPLLLLAYAAMLTWDAWNGRPVGVWLWLIPVIGFFSVWALRTRSRPRLLRFLWRPVPLSSTQPRPRMIELSGGGLRSVEPDGSSRAFAWSAVKAIERMPRHLVFVLAWPNVLVVPSGAFGSDEEFEKFCFAADRLRRGEEGVTDGARVG